MNSSSDLRGIAAGTEVEREDGNYGEMQPVDLSLGNVPSFIPDVDNWTQPNCNYINVEEMLLFESCITFFRFNVKYKKL